MRFWSFINHTFGFTARPLVVLGIGILLLFLHVKPGRYQRLDLFDVKKMLERQQIIIFYVNVRSCLESLCGYVEKLFIVLSTGYLFIGDGCFFKMNLFVLLCRLLVDVDTNLLFHDSLGNSLISLGIIMLLVTSHHWSLSLLCLY